MILHHHARPLLGLTLATFCVSLTQAAKADEYRWPSPQYDALEGLIYEGRRRDGSNLASIQHPCKNRPGSRASIGAEWLRLAYHDVATHNIETGTGGLDASIGFELERGENFGNGMALSILDFETYPSKYISKADVIAAATTFAVASCGGPTLPYRGGRVDAVEADNPGVPEPHQDLATHTEIFRRQGFSPEEMIGLVACGHTLGGVRSADFPQLVEPPEDPDSFDVATFDGTSEFDNDVVTQYIDGTTTNPLVSHANTTMLSDQRIFASDNNATMRKLTSPQEFNSTCGVLLEKMLNIVPANVKLTDEIKLLPIKVTEALLTMEKDQLTFKTSLRVAQPIGASTRNRTVSIFWCDRYGENKLCETGQGKTAGIATNPRIDDVEISPLTFRQGLRFVNYDFVLPLETEESISLFWFEIDEGDGTRPKRHDNAGQGYVVEQDTIIYIPRLSSVTYSGENRSQKAYHIVAAVKQGTPISRVYMSAVDAAIPKFGLPLIADVEMVRNETFPSAAGYDFYSGRVDSIGTQLTVDLHAVLEDGTTHTEDYMQTFYVAGRTPATNPTNVTELKLQPPSGEPDSDDAASLNYSSRGVLYIVGSLSLLTIFA